MRSGVKTFAGDASASITWVKEFEKELFETSICFATRVRHTRSLNKERHQTAVIKYTVVERHDRVVTDSNLLSEHYQFKERFAGSADIFKAAMSLLNRLRFADQNLEFKPAASKVGDAMAVAEVDLSAVSPGTQIEYYAHFYALIEAIEIVFAGQRHKPVVISHDEHKFGVHVPTVESINTELLRRQVALANQLRFITKSYQFTNSRTMVIEKFIDGDRGFAPGLFGSPKERGPVGMRGDNIYKLHIRIAQLRGLPVIAYTHYLDLLELHGKWIAPWLVKDPGNAATAICIPFEGKSEKAVDTIAKELSITQSHNQLLCLMDQRQQGIGEIDFDPVSNTLVLAVSEVFIPKLDALMEPFSGFEVERGGEVLTFRKFLAIPEATVEAALPKLREVMDPVIADEIKAARQLLALRK